MGQRSEPTALELLWLAFHKLEEEKPKEQSPTGRLYAIAITQLQLAIGIVQTFIHLGQTPERILADDEKVMIVKKE